MIQRYTEHFKHPELFASINGQIVSVPVEVDNPLRMAEMTLEDDYGMIDGVIYNGRRDEEREKVAAGMGLFLGRQWQTAVQQALQRLYPSLQAEFTGDCRVLSILSIRPL